MRGRPSEDDWSLGDAISGALAADKRTRIEWRDRIAKHGAAAIDAVLEWTRDPEMGAFAVRVVEAAGSFGARQEALDALASIRSAGASSIIRDDAQQALSRLNPPGRRPSATTKPSGRTGASADGGRRVWVVALSRKAWRGWPADLTPVAEVERHSLYHYPQRRGYAKEVPEYIGFRYDGRLQCIYPVASHEVVFSPYPHVPGAPQESWDDPHNLLHLGAAIVPGHEVASGDVFGPGHNWADLDLLLSCDTVDEAVERTRQRRIAE